MENYKIKVNNESESKEAQDLFEKLGFKWAVDHLENGDWYSHLYAENSTCCYLSPCVWGGLADRFKEITLSQLRDLVAQKQGLISGADALRALADGKEVQQWNGSIWWDVEGNYQIGVFRCGKYKFRLKPSTVKIELEIPAPFEPKEKDIFWTLSTNYKCGYVQILCYRNDEQGERLAQFGVWRTEEEIKQVVAALRGGIKG